jgi:hypothetical protein
MTYLSTIYYLNGVHKANQKLGTVAGPIAHKARNNTSNPGYDYTANKRQDLWAEFDQEPRQTGEESSLGMPSAGGINKAAGLADGDYANQPGQVAEGGFDANRGKPHKDRILSSAIEEAFRANENYDQSYAPETPFTMFELTSLPE